MPLAEALVELQELTKRLRRDCPGDREHTARTIVPHTVEEAYEVADAANAGDPVKLLDELGDLLFQTYFLALLLDEQGTGISRPVARAVHAKLVRRHRHVFGDAEADSGRPGQGAMGGDQDGAGRAAPAVFHDVPDALPGLLYARKVQRRAATAGFDWPDLAGAAREDAGRARRDRGRACAHRAGPRPRRKQTPRVFAELGDLLFTVVNVARVVNVDPELALRATSRRFVTRVELAEQLAAEAGESWIELDLDAQERWYGRAKEQLDPDSGTTET